MRKSPLIFCKLTEFIKPIYGLFKTVSRTQAHFGLTFGRFFVCFFRDSYSILSNFLHHIVHFDEMNLKSIKIQTNVKKISYKTTKKNSKSRPFFLPKGRTQSLTMCSTLMCLELLDNNALSNGDLNLNELNCERKCKILKGDDRLLSAALKLGVVESLDSLLLICIANRAGRTLCHALLDTRIHVCQAKHLACTTDEHCHCGFRHHGML